MENVVLVSDCSAACRGKGGGGGGSEYLKTAQIFNQPDLIKIVYFIFTFEFTVA